VRIRFARHFQKGEDTKQQGTTMNIIDAAEILNVRHDADYLVIKAAYHALAKKHHPDRGGDTATMQRINEAHDYMATRSQAARKTEWERAQRPFGSLDELHRNVEERMRRDREQKAAQSAQASTFKRDWKRPQKPKSRWEIQRQKWADRKRKWNSYLYRHRLARWMVALIRFLLLLAGRLIVVAGMYGAYAEAVIWGTKSLAHGWWWVLIVFPGIAMTLAGFLVTTRFAGTFLLGGWKGIADYIMDRNHDGLTPEPDAWTRKTSNTRWI
jgi:hypothetical protein